MSLFDRVYARCYDIFMDRIDLAGAAKHRCRLVEGAKGEVLEIGAGTGKNLPLYGAAERVVALELTPRCGREPKLRCWRHGFLWK